MESELCKISYSGNRLAFPVRISGEIVADAVLDLVET
jgi:hypothetical protein